MTTDDLKKMDFPIATMKMLQSATAMLCTVLQNQITIMAALNIDSREAISADVNRLLQENLAIVESDLKREVPEGQYMIFPKN